MTAGRRTHLSVALASLFLISSPLGADAQTNAPAKKTTQAKKAAPKAAGRQQVCAAEWQKRMAELEAEDEDGDLEWEPGEQEALRRQFMTACVASNAKF